MTQTNGAERYSALHALPAAWRTDTNPRLVGDGIALFRDPEDSRLPLPPSLALIRELPSRGPAPADFPVRPAFAWHAGRRISRVSFAGMGPVSVYGTGEVAGPLLRNGTRMVCWNTDSFEYTDENVSLYQSHPWVLCVRRNGTAFGLLADTTFRCEIDIRGDEDPGVTFAAEGLPYGLYVIERETPQQVLAALAELTGHMPLPPRWSLGYHQSRWSYEPDSRVRELAAEFRRRRIPCDVIWLDIDYMNGFRCFTFDPVKFPDPAGLNRDLHALGFKTVWMIDPGIKVDEHYFAYQQTLLGDHAVKTLSGENFVGEVWPGPCVFPDFTRAATREWWSSLYSGFLMVGMDGVWNDMNEPALFDFPRKHMPEDNIHRGDPALGGPGTHARYHNVYGMLMVRATREGIERARPDQRPFVLTRSNFLGGHRYAATWTGDNKADWEHLAWSIPMVLNLGLSGQPFSGPDIGGFAGDATPELYARWMGIGGLLPFARGHSIKDSKHHEPWSFGEETELVCRLALQRRYRLLPHLYTLFREASLSGQPVARPLFFADPADPRLRDAEDSFLLGNDLLVRCRVSPTGPCLAPLPRGTWRGFEPCGGLGGTVSPGPAIHTDLPDLFVRAGAIVPLGPVVQFEGERPLDPLTLVVCPDASGQASGVLYEDAGDGPGYREGLFRITTWQAHREGDSITVTAAHAEGRLHRPERTVEIAVLLPRGMVRTASGREGHPVSIPVHASDLAE